jgi:hypothetical protein
MPLGSLQTLCCPRCGKPICADPAATERAAPAAEGLSRYDGWELDEQLAHIQRVLQNGREACPDIRTNDNAANASAGLRELARFDPPQAGPPSRHVASHRSRKRRKTPSRRRSISGGFIWLILSLGTMSLACGGTLLVSSLIVSRQELWNFGLPMAVAGQIALLLGLVLQIDRLWHDSRRAACKLDDVDEQIHELKTSTLLLGASQGPASVTFYSHLAGGANPQLLLTDLKSQLDLLAMKISQED